MTARDDIAAIIANGGNDKPLRIARLKAQRLRAALAGQLPFTWEPQAGTSVAINRAEVNGNAIDFAIDLTIQGVTKSLSTWIEGRHSAPDWRIVNPPLFVADPSGDVEIVIGETADGQPVRLRGRDDLVAAMRQAFVDTFGEKIADLVRAAR